MTLAIPSVKHPDAVRPYRHDFKEAMLIEGVDTGDTVRTSLDPDLTKRPTCAVQKGDAVVEGFLIEGTELVYWVSGGTKDTWFYLSVWTVNGLRIVETTLLKIGA